MALAGVFGLGVFATRAHGDLTVVCQNYFVSPSLNLILPVGPHLTAGEVDALRAVPDGWRNILSFLSARFPKIDPKAVDGPERLITAIRRRVAPLAEPRTWDKPVLPRRDFKTEWQLVLDLLDSASIEEVTVEDAVNLTDVVHGRAVTLGREQLEELRSVPADPAEIVRFLKSRYPNFSVRRPRFMHRAINRLWLECFGLERPRPVVMPTDADVILYRPTKTSAEARVREEWQLFQSLLLKYGPPPDYVFPVPVEIPPAVVEPIIELPTKVWDRVLVDQKTGRVIPILDHYTSAEGRILKTVPRDPRAVLETLIEIFPEIDCTTPHGTGQILEAARIRLRGPQPSTRAVTTFRDRDRIVPRFQEITNGLPTVLPDDEAHREIAEALEHDIRLRIATADPAFIACVDRLPDTGAAAVQLLRSIYRRKVVSEAGFVAAALSYLWADTFSVLRPRPVVKPWDGYSIDRNRKANSALARVRKEMRLFRAVLARYRP